MGKMTNLHRQIRWETASNGGNGNYHSGPRGLGCKPSDPKTIFNPDTSITSQIQHYTGLNGHSKLAEILKAVLIRKRRDERDEMYMGAYKSGRDQCSSVEQLCREQKLYI